MWVKTKKALHKYDHLKPIALLCGRWFFIWCDTAFRRLLAQCDPDLKNSMICPHVNFVLIVTDPLCFAPASINWPYVRAMQFAVIPQVGAWHTPRPAWQEELVDGDVITFFMSGDLQVFGPGPPVSSLQEGVSDTRNSSAGATSPHQSHDWRWS